MDINKTMAARVTTAQFGDGYTQRASVGINPITDTWDLSWIWLPAAEGIAIESALRATLCVEKILWTPKDELTQKKWVVVPDSITYQSNGIKRKISCKLQQVF